MQLPADMDRYNSWRRKCCKLVTGPRILKDYSPGFFAKTFPKDLGPLDEAERMRLFLPATLQAKKTFTKALCDDGFGAALIKIILEPTK